MVNEKDVSGNLHWGINVPDGTTNVLVPESGIVDKVWLELKGVLGGLRLEVWRFLLKAWDLGVAEPKKVIHALKVGLALSIVSLFYYMRSLYESVGGNAMWAVMTVVVVFESTVGATLYKSINRAAGTFLAGSLGLGVHWIAYKSGEKLEPIIIGISVFFFASAATFSRFIPSVKSRFDYGALIFILTFSLVSVSGYRVGELSELAYDRLSTIGIGTSFCILISMLFYPTWAGDELHRLIYRNLEKLADSLDGHVLEYFKDNEAVTEDNCPTKEIKGYKCVLDSKATEDNWAKLARWEPAHGSFNFKHPWKQYLKIGASMRSCAYCIEALSSCMESETQAAGIGQLKKHLSNACKTTNKYSSGILRELAKTIKTMTKSTDMGSLVWEMNNAVQELQNSLKSVPIGLIAPTPEDTDDGKGESFITPVVEVLPVTTLVSLLIENAARINGIVDAVNELAGQVEMKPALQENSKQYKPSSDTPH
ncbi:aluminum-activated malate transporter 10-like [Prunus avium]|uniref:Aluminum-activated malate transporter 10-like n=1 Tax=Prunus avium TaxID=42229 RepID=A0A6P5SMR4_PRUAV|nr:aluminum-activated malate transporter 10-like [Prunus avium]